MSFVVEEVDFLFGGFSVSVVVEEDFFPAE